MTFRTRLIRLPRSGSLRRTEYTARCTDTSAPIRTLLHTFRVDASLPVTSTCIARLEYEPETEECTYTFYHGGSYTSIIPEIEVMRWINSDSPGAPITTLISGDATDDRLPHAQLPGDRPASADHTR